MQPLLLTLLSQLNNTLSPFLHFPSAIKFKKASIEYAPSFLIYPLITVNIASLSKQLISNQFPSSVDSVYVFTNQSNLNKLYIDSNSGIFLSPGIVLSFINLDKSRFLNNRLRTWYGYVNALQLLQSNPFVLYFADLNGKNSILLNNINASNIQVAWALIKLFNNQHSVNNNRARRINRWIRNNYYQLEVGESG